MVRLAALVGALLLLGGAAMGQPAPGEPKKPAEEKKPSQLEELLAQALRDNPDVRVAEAKMREAEAELNRARLQAIQKVVAHQHNTETLESAVKTAQARVVVAETNVRLAEAEYQRMADIAKKGVVAQSEVDAAQAKVKQAAADLEAAKAGLQAAKADLAKAQAELPYLLGKATKDDKADATMQVWEFLRLHRTDETAAERLIYTLSMTQAKTAWTANQQPRGTVAEKLRKALDAPINVRFEEQSLDDVLRWIQAQAGVPVVDTLPRDLKTKKLTLSVSNISQGAAFQLLEDVAGVQFAVRDYGILVSDKLPSGVTRLHDFWKAAEKPKAAEEKPRPAGKNPPPGNVEGKVTEVDADAGLVAIAVSGDPGLAKGHTLEVYRHTEDKLFRYLGTLRIENVKGDNAVGKVINRVNAPLKVGDRVSSKFFVD